MWPLVILFSWANLNLFSVRSTLIKMENITSKSFNASLICQVCNGIRNNSLTDDSESTSEVIVILQSLIACVGTAANSTVVIVFLNNKKQRGKIPTIFIINQVSLIKIHYTALWNAVPVVFKKYCLPYTEFTLFLVMLFFLNESIKILMCQNWIMITK